MTVSTLHRLENVFTVIHANYKDCKSKIIDHIEDGRKGYMMFLMGPSRIGKTRLISHIYQEFVDKISSGDIKNFSPPIIVMASANPRDTSLWISLIREMLFALGDRDFDEKACLSTVMARQPFSVKTSGNARLSLDSLKLLLKQRVALYKPICIFVDEVGLMVASGGHESQLRRHAAFLHELACILDTKIILIGTCAATEMLNLNEQVALRTNRVYFQRYRNNAKDINSFNDIVLNIVKGIGIKVSADFYKSKKELHEGSLGCVGEFSAWLHRAIVRMNKLNKDVLTMEHMRSERTDCDRLMAAEREIRLFESHIDNSKKVFSFDQFDRDMGLVNTETSQGPRKNPLKPGQRLPINDPVGSLFTESV